MQRTALAAPFLAAGAVKVAYDLVIYAAFRQVVTDDGDGTAADVVPSVKS
jgi:hypothetical protein